MLLYFDVSDDHISVLTIVVHIFIILIYKYELKHLLMKN